jgi:hypothetical protein
MPIHISPLEDITNKLNKVNKMMQNPNIAFFIIMLLVLLISCYGFISNPIKNTLAYILSNPIIILFSICIIIIIAYFNITIGALTLILLFLCIYGSNTNFTNQTTGNHNFSNGIMEHFSDKPSKLEKMKEDEKKVNDQVKSIKDTILTTFNKFKDVGSSDYKQALLDNKKKLFESEKNNNSKKTSINTQKDTFDNIENEPSTHNNNKPTPKHKTKKEKFQTVNRRTFDPTNEEDTNLQITKEILQDVINRIEYDYESSKYLHKYIKHRIEEIIEINKLTDDE